MGFYSKQKAIVENQGGYAKPIIPKLSKFLIKENGISRNQKLNLLKKIREVIKYKRHKGKLKTGHLKKMEKDQYYWAIKHLSRGNIRVAFWCIKDNLRRNFQRLN